jgi:hypothetical protein
VGQSDGIASSSRLALALVCSPHGREHTSGALLLVVSLVNVFLLFSSFLSRDLEERDSSGDLPR